MDFPAQQVDASSPSAASKMGSLSDGNIAVAVFLANLRRGLVRLRFARTARLPPTRPMDARVEAGIWRECLRHSPANGDGERSSLGGLHSLVDVWHPQPPVLQRDLPPFGATPPIATALPAPLVDEAFSHALYGISPHGLGGLGGLDQPRQLPYSPLHPGLYAPGSSPPPNTSNPLSVAFCVAGSKHSTCEA